MGWDTLEAGDWISQGTLEAGDWTNQTTLEAGNWASQGTLKAADWTEWDTLEAADGTPSMLRIDLAETHWRMAIEQAAHIGGWRLNGLGHTLYCRLNSLRHLGAY